MPKISYDAVIYVCSCDGGSERFPDAFEEDGESPKVIDACSGPENHYLACPKHGGFPVGVSCAKSIFLNFYTLHDFAQTGGFVLAI